MAIGGHVLSHEKSLSHSASRYLLDTVLAFVGAMGVTALISFYHLYPRIPNISMVYLLIVLTLATTRGRYAALLAALVAFLAFNFFLVPPFYTLVIYQVEEWIALFVFLITALITGQLAVALRERAEQASRRERETHLLYDLVRKTNHEEEPEQQLDVIVRTVQEVLAPWGVQECTLMQPDQLAPFPLQESTSSFSPVLTAQEMASWVLAHGRMATLYDEQEKMADISSFSDTGSTRTPNQKQAKVGARQAVCFIPLVQRQQGVNVLCLRLRDHDGQSARKERVEAVVLAPRRAAPFFWTFLDQVAALVERACLQQETVRMAVLQRTDALRAALLSSVSHDLRSPLTGIKAAASSLLQRDIQWDEEAQQGFAESIEREADRLNRLVGNLLDMSRIEEGALKPDKEKYALTSLVYDVLARLDSLFVGRVVEVHAPNELLLVDIDYLQIDQVITNLLENAIRHTPVGTPVEIEIRREGREILFSVADRGPGIPLADLERVFDKFYRVLREQQPSPLSPDTSWGGGSGLGLSVCRGLVEAHGGRVWAVQRQGGGLIVSMVLPQSAEEA